MSCAKLTDESAPDGACGAESGVGHKGAGGRQAKLYRWSENAPPGHHLVDLTLDHEPADGIGSHGSNPGSGELAIAGVSDDGDTVFFTARGQLVAGEPLQSAGAKIYRWRWNGGEPTVDYLGSFLAYQGYEEKSEAVKLVTLGQRLVTPDGKYLLIETRGRIDPVADQDNDRDAYRWDEASGWQCVSCQSPGVPSAGSSLILEAFTGTHNNFFGTQLYGGPLSMAMTDDGRVFFTTPDALVPEDVNGETTCPSTLSDDSVRYTCQDLYEWKEGRVSLISSGTGSEAVKLLGTTPSGDDVFFFDRQRLVGWDKDNGVDIYDARVGGGFPEPPTQPPGCEGEACRGAGSAVPVSAGAGTAAFDGPGNAVARRPPTRRRCPKGKRRVRRGGKVRCVKRRAHRRAHRHHRRAAGHDRRVGR